MRIIRFAEQEKVNYGVLMGDIIHSIQGDPFEQFTSPGCMFDLDGSTHSLDDVKLLAPCTPSKIICIGLNHWSHIKAAEKAPMIGNTKVSPRKPVVPHFFIKPSTALIGTDDTIVIPDLNRRVCFEGEMAAVIGKIAKNVSEKRAKEYVLGYTCHNDVTDIDVLTEERPHLTRGKGFDTFAPTGPWIETEVDPDDLKIETHLNGELRQSDRTSGLVYNISNLVSFVSCVMTLLPGDVISTGTPMGVSPMKPGDVVEITIEHIGTLRNYLASSKMGT